MCREGMWRQVDRREEESGSEKGSPAVREKVKEMKRLNTTGTVPFGSEVRNASDIDVRIFDNAV